MCVHLIAGKSTLLQILAGQYMVGPDAVRILGRPAFHDIQLTSSGQLSYLGQQWRRDIAFAGYNVPIQVSLLCLVALNVSGHVRLRYGHESAEDGLAAQSACQNHLNATSQTALSVVCIRSQALNGHAGRHWSREDDLWGGRGGPSEAAAAHRPTGDRPGMAPKQGLRWAAPPSADLHGPLETLPGVPFCKDLAQSPDLFWGDHTETLTTLHRKCQFQASMHPAQGSKSLAQSAPPHYMWIMCRNALVVIVVANHFGHGHHTVCSCHFMAMVCLSNGPLPRTCGARHTFKAQSIIPMT